MLRLSSTAQNSFLNTLDIYQHILYFKAKSDTPKATHDTHRQYQSSAC
ncbi:hypothetical protein [Moraxella lacunata]